MDNYMKGENIEKPLALSDIPISNIPSDVTWMKVKPGSKMNHLIEFSLKAFTEKNCQLWSGVGPAIGKTISCVEIIKRRCANLHQVSKIVYHTCEELWIPKIEELDTIKVVRNIPAIHIMLSSEPLDPNQSGYQDSNLHNSFWNKSETKRDRIKHKKNTQVNKVMPRNQGRDKTKKTRLDGYKFQFP
nr:EOG090X0KMN [Sida crystallina]